MKFRYQINTYYRKLIIFAICTTTVLLIGCSQKTGTSANIQTAPLSATIVEIDDHGNAVTDLEISAFTARGWKLGDTLEATFETGQKVQIQFVENYGDVPVGDYLGRFSTSTERFKIAINMGDIAKTLELSSTIKVTLQKVEPSPAN